MKIKEPNVCKGCALCLAQNYCGFDGSYFMEWTREVPKMAKGF